MYLYYCLGLSDATEKKKKLPPRQYPVSNPPPWIPKPEVSVVSVQPQDTSIKDDDEIPYSSSDEEETITVRALCDWLKPISCHFLNQSKVKQKPIVIFLHAFYGRVFLNFSV